MLSHDKFIFASRMFDVDYDLTKGLNLRIRGGARIDAARGPVSTPGATVALAASATNYVEVDDNGNITSNTSKFSSTTTFLYIVKTGTALITDITDVRHQGLVDPLLTPRTAIASASTKGSVARLLMQNILDASADTDIIVDDALRVLDFFILNTGIAAHATLDTVQLKKGATAITNALAKTATVNAIIRAGTFDPAQVVFAAGDTLRFTAAHNTNVACTAYVLVASL
jgi:hypothetical protein